MSKKIISVILIAIMILGLLPIIPVSAAANIIALRDTDDTMDITNAVKGDTILVIGDGVTAGSVINVYWDSVKAWDGSKGKLNSTEGNSDGTFDVWIDVPESKAGNHYIWVKDMDTSQTDSALLIVDPKLTVKPDSGLYQDKITITAYGFGASIDVTTIEFRNMSDVAMPGFTPSPAIPETSSLGSWTATFRVPVSDYGDYYVYAEDENMNSATDGFTVGASIELDIEEGPEGCIVEVSGRGFTPYADVATVEMDSTICYLLDDISIDSDGEFRGEFVVPSLGKGDWTVMVTDDDISPEYASTDFEITGETSIEFEPEYGVQGSMISIWGYNFTQISGEEVDVVFVDLITLIETPLDSFDVDSNGEFEGSFQVPAVSSEAYAVRAYMDEDAHGVTTEEVDVNDEVQFRVGLMIVILNPTSGPTGKKVTMTGAGFTENMDWNATFGDLDLVTDGDVEPDGSFSTSFFVPTVDPGTYTITVLDIETGIELEVQYTVTARTVAETDPATAPNGYNTTLSGMYFAQQADTTLDWLLYNVTDDGEVDEDWTMSISGYYRKVDKDGEFEVYWKVPANDVLSLGDYIINVTDAEGMWAQIEFSVVAKTLQIESRKETFNIKDTVSFDIAVSFSYVGSVIKIWDPDGVLFWQTDPLNTWIDVGVLDVAPYYTQVSGGNPMILLDDSPLGEWSWTWYEDATSGADELDTGTFMVDEAIESQLSAQLTQLQGDLTQLTTDFEGVSSNVDTLSTSVAALSDSVAQAIAAANAANNAVQDVAAAVASVADTAINAADAANSAATAASSAKDAADRAGAAASGLTNLVYAAIVAALVAAVAAVFSLLQISRRIAG